MPRRPLISKIRCADPNKKRSAIRNRNYLIYIATRDGVDITPARYGDTEYHEALFGNMVPEAEEEYSLEDIANHTAEITRHQNKVIYRGVISLCEEDAINLGYNDRSKWILYANSVMPDIAKEFGIEVQNMKWVGAVHMEKGHPHMHYMLWNESNAVEKAYIHVSKQNRIREKLSKEMFNEEYREAVITKNADRDALIELGKEFMKELSDDFLPGTINAAIPERINNKDLDMLTDELKKLINMLPEKGRVNYQLIPPECKAQVDVICNMLMERPDFARVYKKYLETVKLINHNIYGYNDYKDKNNVLHKDLTFRMDKAKDDINKRIGNIILKAAKEIRKEQAADAYKKDLENRIIRSRAFSLVGRVFQELISCNDRQRAEAAEIGYKTQSKQLSRELAKNKSKTPEE